MASLRSAVQAVRDSTAEAEEGKTYLGKVVKIMEFGAFVNILPNVDGLCHISELADARVAKVEDVVREGHVTECFAMIVSGSISVVAGPAVNVRGTGAVT